jgi:hypothetical protein
MQNPRTRLISIRMSDEEYTRLLRASAGNGARSVSEFARHALLNSAQEPAAPCCWRQDFDSLDERITRVERDVTEIKNEIIVHGHPRPDGQEIE